jgi:hypothetical protein
MVTITVIFNSDLRQVLEMYQDTMTTSTHILSNSTFIFTLLLNRNPFDSKARDTPTQRVKIHTVPHFILELLNLIPLISNIFGSP